MIYLLSGICTVIPNWAQLPSRAHWAKLRGVLVGMVAWRVGEGATHSQWMVARDSTKQPVMLMIVPQQHGYCMVMHETLCSISSTHVYTQYTHTLTHAQSAHCHREAMILSSVFSFFFNFWSSLLSRTAKTWWNSNGHHFQEDGLDILVCNPLAKYD